MRVKFARLENFRNIEFAEAHFEEDSVWIFGRNAQGKTNLLEALGLLNAMRSFRGAKSAALVRKGAPAARLLFCLEHETFGRTEVCMEIGARSKSVDVGGEQIAKMSDFVGLFPALALCSEDIQLLRGAPLSRRKFVDMAISTVDREYLDCLKRYNAALDSRNGLLRGDSHDADLFDAFESQMAYSAHIVRQKRAEYLDVISKSACGKYSVLSRADGEGAEINLKPDCEISSPDDFIAVLRECRAKDRLLGSTQNGPHRDDFSILIDSLDARRYASEGQQRSLVLSLKLAFFDLVKARGKVLPALLCDDILGELDPIRRDAFWECIDSSVQVVATATVPPPSSGARADWVCIRAEKGHFERV